MSLAPVVGIMVIVVVVGIMVYQGNSNSVVSGVSSAFDTMTKGSPNEGFQITHVTPKEPTQTTVIDNGDSQTTQEVIVQQQDEIKTYSVSNIPPIDGYIKLYDANQNPIKPYSYDYRITVSCSEIADSFDFCQFDNAISNRGTTENGGLDNNGNELGGKYYWNWSLFQTQDKILPSNTDEVILQVSLFVDVTLPDNSLVTKQSSYLMRIVP